MTEQATLTEDVRVSSYITLEAGTPVVVVRDYGVTLDVEAMHVNHLDGRLLGKVEFWVLDGELDRTPDDE